MPGYGQFCPVAQALEIVGERWTLLVIRELLCRSARFSDIQRGVPLMSRSVLAKRLSSLCEAGVIERDDDGYHLTEAGEELRPLVLAIGSWGQRWARREIANADVDVGLLVWDMRRRIDPAAVPRDMLVELEFRGAPAGKGRFWLHYRGDEVDLCLQHPGHEVDLRVTTTPRVMAEIWLGDRSIAGALREGALRIAGSRRLSRAFTASLQRSVFATVQRPA